MYTCRACLDPARQLCRNHHRLDRAGDAVRPVKSWAEKMLFCNAIYVVR